MANSPTDSDPFDHLSNLPDGLLVTILSFLPTHIAARTSVLCRRFRHLWEASPSLALSNYDLPVPRSKNFTAMAKCLMLRRNPSHPLHSLSLDVCDCHDKNAIAMVSSLLSKARSLDLRHLTIGGFCVSDLLPILSIVFTINSLRCLSLRLSYSRQELNFPSGINLTSLRSLSLQLFWVDMADLNPLLSELRSLEDLHLRIKGIPGLSLSSQTIRKLKLIIAENTQKLDTVGLSLPLLESLHLEIQSSLGNMCHIHAKVPLLTKAVIKLHFIRENHVSFVVGLLNCISRVEELSLYLVESTCGEHPIPILLESGKDVPHFHNLKHLDVTLCFHEHNLADVIMMLHNCPILKSLKLVHEIYFQTGKKRKDWQSKLPRNADGNYHYAYFKNLHLEENRKEVIKLLSKKCRSKRSIMDILVEETCAIRGNKGKGLYGKSIATAPNCSIARTFREVSSSVDDNTMTQQQIDDFGNPEFHVMPDSVEVVHEPVYESVNPSPDVPISEPVVPMPNVPEYEPVHLPSSQNSKRGNNSGDQCCTQQKQSVNRMDEFAERFLCQQEQRTELIAQLGKRTELIAQLGQANSVHDQVLNKLQSLALPPAIHVDMELILVNSWIRSCFIKEDDNERFMIFVDRVVELFRSGKLPLNS